MKHEFIVGIRLDIPAPNEQKKLVVQLLESLYDAKSLTDKKDDKDGIWRYRWHDSFDPIPKDKEELMKAVLKVYRHVKGES